MQDDLPHTFLRLLLLPLISLMLVQSNNDPELAWNDAMEAANSFGPQNAIEFRLAVRVAVFNIQANIAAADASKVGVSPVLATRMRSNAITLARAADKAEMRLEKLQAERRKNREPAVQPAPEPVLAETTEPAPAETPIRTPASAPAPARPTVPPAVPAYKLRKLEKRLARQRERDARTQAQALAENLPDAA